MAERRMFAKTIIDSDAFLEMPLSTQALYFHLSMRADDDGFINNPKKIARLINATDDDLKLLVAKNFIIPFASGIVVIKHWRIHNYIQNDRYKPTVYTEEAKCLNVKENKAYTLVSNMDTECIQTVSKVETQDRLGKDRLEEGKDRLEKKKVEKKKFADANEIAYPNDQLLDNAFRDYVLMRAEIKKPLTEHARDLQIKHLNELSGGDSDKAIKILEQSTRNCWSDLYAIKGNKADTGKVNWDQV